MRLIYANSKKPVQLGDVVAMRDGQEGVVEAIVEPHKPSSTGRVRVRTGSHMFASEYFPQVIAAVWEGRP